MKNSSLSSVLFMAILLLTGVRAEAQSDSSLDMSMFAKTWILKYKVKANKSDTTEIHKSTKDMIIVTIKPDSSLSVIFRYPQFIVSTAKKANLKNLTRVIGFPEEMTQEFIKISKNDGYTYIYVPKQEE